MAKKEESVDDTHGFGKIDVPTFSGLVCLSAEEARGPLPLCVYKSEEGND